MAYSNSINFPLTLLLLMTISVSAFEFQVGSGKGWILPPANDTKIYNDWASENRFRAGDTIRFKYKKDSVMEVTEEEYKKCNSTEPIFFSNTGNTVFNLGHSGTYYFISGANGHCEKGQKMIVKVMADDDQDQDQKSSAASIHNIIHGEKASSFGFLKLVSSQLVLSYVASLVFF